MIACIQILRLKRSLIRKGLRRHMSYGHGGCFRLKRSLIRKGLRLSDVFKHLRDKASETLPDS